MIILLLVIIYLELTKILFLDKSNAHGSCESSAANDNLVKKDVLNNSKQLRTENTFSTNSMFSDKSHIESTDDIIFHLVRYFIQYFGTNK